MGNYLILPANKKHAEAIKQIYKECKSELGSFNLYQCWDMYLAGQGNEKFDVIVSWSAITVGFVRWCYSKKYGSYLVKDIGVLNKFRGEGLGLKLMQHVPVPVMLKCNANNETGNQFYESIGMKKSGTTQTKKGNPQIIWTCAEW